jgi:hypothetical protein
MRVATNSETTMMAACWILDLAAQRAALRRYGRMTKAILLAQLPKSDTLMAVEPMLEQLTEFIEPNPIYHQPCAPQKWDSLIDLPTEAELAGTVA